MFFLFLCHRRPKSAIVRPPRAQRHHKLEVDLTDEDTDGLPQFQKDFDAIARQFLDEVAAPQLSVLARCVTKTLPSSQFPPL